MLFTLFWSGSFLGFSTLKNMKTMTDVQLLLLATSLQMQCLQ